MHLDSATAGSACRRTICASNQLREITAWAFRSSGDAGSVHLRRNHAYEILFYADTVDGRNPSVVRDQFQCAAEYLVFGPLPVKTNPDTTSFSVKEASAPHGSNRKRP